MNIMNRNVLGISLSIKKAKIVYAECASLSVSFLTKLNIFILSLSWTKWLVDQIDYNFNVEYFIEQGVQKYWARRSLAYRGLSP